MSEPIRPTYQALVDAAVDVSGAARGWLLRLDGDGLVVTAAAGGERANDRVGIRRPLEGTAGYVAISGQPAALQIRGEDEANRGAGGSDDLPNSILAAPCGADEVLGVLEVVDAASGSFGFDEVEVVSLLADIASTHRRRP